MYSIQRRLNRTFFFAIALFIGAAIFGFYRIAHKEIHDAFDDNLMTKAYAVTALTDQKNGKVTFDFSEDFFAYFENESPVTCFQMWDADGKTIFVSNRNFNAPLPLPKKGTAANPDLSEIVTPAGNRMRVVSFSFTPRPEEEDGIGYDPLLKLQVSVAMDSGGIEDTFSTLLFAAICTWIIFTGSLLFIARRMLRRGFRPLEELSRQLNELNEKKPSWRVSLSEQPKELRTVVKQLNALLERLEALFARERRFNSAVAHELRTPVAELRSLAECAVAWPDSRDAGTDRAALEIALRMEAVITRLLAISRGELDKLKTNIVDFEISGEIKKIADKFAEKIAKKNLRLSLDISEKNVSDDCVFFDSIIENLIDNAVEYTPDGGEISVTGKIVSGDNAEDYVIEITNPAPALSEQDIGFIFEPFWRKEAARSDARHSGLGLNIARVFAKATGKTLTAALTPPGCVTFTLRKG